MSKRKKEIKAKVADAISKLSKLSVQELCEVHDNTNSWKWDTRMGDEPENWKYLVLYALGWWREKNTTTRYSYLKPINEFIRKRVSEKEMLRHHHIHNLHRTEEEFEKWWRENILEN